MSEYKQRDAFISYAREDKEEIASPLAELLKESGLNIWIDEEGIAADKGVRAEIDSALAASDFGVVIASHAYFSHRDKWTQRELDAIQGLEASGKMRIITVCHNLDTPTIQRYSPLLAGKHLLSSKEGLPQVASEIVKTVKGEKSPEAQTFFEELQRKSVCQFLTEVEEYCNRVQLFRGQSITLKNFYIPIEVTLEHLQNKAETIRGYLEDEMQLSRAYALKWMMEWESRREQIPWQEVKQKYKHIMVLADPGMGKTALLKMEAVRMAQQARQLLENKEKNVDEVILPIFLKLFDLTKKPDAERVERILQQLQQHYQKTFKPIKALVHRKLEQGTCILLLDALDETPSEQRLELADHLNIFARHSPCPMICTSRIVGYGSGFLRDAKEVEIVPFSRKQIEKYIEIWFKNAEETLKDSRSFNNLSDAKGLIRKLRQQPQIHGLAQNPLLLSLLCSLYQEDELTLPARRVQIYERAVQYMLYRWRQDSQRRLTEKALTDSAWIEAKLELLEQLAYHFSCEDKEIFSMRELLAKIEACKGDTALKHHNAPDIIKELLEEDGIIQQLDGQGRNTRYIFLHRTFQEYLTASYLKYHPNGIELAKEHFWNFDWHETIALLAGLLDNPIPLLQKITDEKDDIFSTLLLLAGQCLTECKKIDNSSLIKQIVTKIFTFWHSYSGLQFIGTKIARIIQAHGQFLEDFKRYIYDNKGQMLMGATNVLGRIDSQQATQILINALNSPNNSYIQGLILQALHEIELPEAIESLNYYLEFLLSELNSQDTNIRENAIWRLGDIGTPNAIKILQQILNNENKHLQTIASIVLEQIGNHEAIQVLSQAIDHKSEYVRTLAIQRLGKIDNEKALQVITQVCYHKNQTIGMLAISVLSETSNCKAIEILAQTLNHHDKNIRLATINALGKIENQEAIKILIQAFDHPDKLVKIQAILTLRLLNSPHAQNALEQAYHHKDVFVRQIAEMNLEKFDSQLIESLKQTLLDPKKKLQKIASEILLVNCSEEEIIDFLEKKLDNEDQDEKLKSITILRALGTLKAVDILSKAFQDTDDIVCAGAVDALEKIALQHKEPVSQRAINVLQQSLVHENHIVRMRAVGALEKVRVIETLYILVEHPDIDIYDPINLSVARTLIIHFNKENSPLIPLYPDLLRRKLPQFRVRPDLQ